MKGKTETNSLYEWVNCSLPIKRLKKNPFKAFYKLFEWFAYMSEEH